MSFLGPTCAKKGTVWATPPKKQTLFEEIAKADHSFQTLYFIKVSYVLAELCFSICMVFVKSVIRHSVFIHTGVWTTKFQKLICPGKNDYLIHKSPGIYEKMIPEKNFQSPTSKKLTVQKCTFRFLEKIIIKGPPEFLHSYPCMDKKWNNPFL